MPGDEFIDFAHRELIENREIEAQRPGGEREPVASVARDPVWSGFRDEIVTPAGSELPDGSLCWERVQVSGEWSGWAGPTPCQTQATPVPEPGVAGLLALVLLLSALNKRRRRGER